jgi:geranylgeranyl pyrophosphate synthase
MEVYRDVFNKNFNKFTVDYVNTNDIILEQTKYMTSGGKRLRGILAYAFGCIEIKDNYEVNSSKLCISHLIELIHCLSLVLDDTPIMDDDKYRRDNPSFFLKYGIDYTYNYFYFMATKITLIFNKINSKYYNVEYNQKYNSIINIFLKKINIIFTDIIKILIDGQFKDINYEKIKGNYENCNLESNKLLNSNEIYENIINLCSKNKIKTIDVFQKYKLIKNIDLNLRKTSSLFILSTVMPLIYNVLDLQLEKYNNDIKNNIDNIDNIDNINLLKIIENLIERVIKWSCIFGIIFQYTDDLLDIEQDNINCKPNIFTILDKSKVFEIIENGIKWLKNEIDEIKCIYDTNLMLKMDDKIIYTLLEKIKSRITNLE